jgi:hypothetical protein
MIPRFDPLSTVKRYESLKTAGAIYRGYLLGRWPPRFSLIPCQPTKSLSILSFRLKFAVKEQILNQDAISRVLSKSFAALEMRGFHSPFLLIRLEE